MADAKHTPGPLTVQRSAGADREGEVGVLSEGRHVVAECWADIRRKGEQALDEAMANALLYAAAPELLAALQVLVDRDLGYASGYVDRGLIRIQDVQAARRAIAKATGSTT